MATFIKPPQFWIRVPDGSTFEGKIEGTNDNYISSMIVDSSGDDDALVTDAELKAGYEKTLNSPNQYVMTVFVDFAGLPEPSVTFRARIIEPGGTQFENDYTFTVSDPDLAPYRAVMIIVMKA